MKSTLAFHHDAPQDVPKSCSARSKASLYRRLMFQVSLDV